MIQPLHNSPSRLADLDVDAINQLLLTDDWSDLARDERVARYRTLCDLLGLEWRWMPIELWKDRHGRRKPGITARASHMLAVRYQISTAPIATQFRSTYVMVEVRARTPDGREMIRKGAVSIEGKSGQEAADAEKWAETQAGKRAILGLLGIGLPDESEASLFPGASRAAFDVETGAMTGDGLADQLDDDDASTIDRRAIIGFRIRARELGWKRPEWMWMLQSRYNARHEGAIRRVRLVEVTAALADKELLQEIREELNGTQGTNDA